MNVRRTLARLLRRGVGPLLPAALRLPFRSRLAWFEGVGPELHMVYHLGPRRGTALDIGANEGLVAYALSRLYDRVLAFEVNDEVTGPLRAYAAGRNVEVHAVGLSSVNGDATLYVPVRAGRPISGWASLQPGNVPDADGHREIPVSVRTLDSFELTGVTFIKADVEGHELEVLAGARETIRQNRPVVLIEVKESNRAAAAAFFEPLGYAERRLEDLLGVPDSYENVLYVPTPAA